MHEIVKWTWNKIQWNLVLSNANYTITANVITEHHDHLATWNELN